jgi:hypothetical protein
MYASDQPIQRPTSSWTFNSLFKAATTRTYLRMPTQKEMAYIGGSFLGLCGVGYLLKRYFYPNNTKNNNALTKGNNIPTIIPSAPKLSESNNIPLNEGMLSVHFINDGQTKHINVTKNSNNNVQNLKQEIFNQMSDTIKQQYTSPDNITIMCSGHKLNDDREVNQRLKDASFRIDVVFQENNAHDKTLVNANHNPDMSKNNFSLNTLSLGNTVNNGQSNMQSIETPDGTYSVVRAKSTIVTSSDDTMQIQSTSKVFTNPDPEIQRITEEVIQSMNNVHNKKLTIQITNWYTRGTCHIPINNKDTIETLKDKIFERLPDEQKNKFISSNNIVLIQKGKPLSSCECIDTQELVVMVAKPSKRKRSLSCGGIPSSGNLRTKKDNVILPKTNNFQVQDSNDGHIYSIQIEDIDLDNIKTLQYKIWAQFSRKQKQEYESPNKIRLIDAGSELKTNKACASIVSKGPIFMLKKQPRSQTTSQVIPINRDLDKQ